MATKNTEELVTIKLPRIPGEETVYVSVNERSWLIKRGCEVQIPHCAYDVLRRSEIAEDIAVQYKESVTKAEG